MKKVLIACEFSGTVRDAFLRQGYYAVSCDLLPTESPGPHLQTSVLDILYDGWDLMIAHPPCTYLTNSGVRWLYGKHGGTAEKDEGRWHDMREAANFFWTLLNAPIPKIAVENPIMHKYAIDIIGEKQTQVIQPWQFGHGEIKATGLWLRNLPPLIPTDIVDGREARVLRASPSPTRWKERSITLPGIAEAMATQWGPLI